MKKKILIVTYASAASLWAFTAVAQDSPDAKDRMTTNWNQSATHTMWGNKLGCSEKASDIMGREVKNYQNEKLGKVSDLAVDVESGRIVYVILSRGGFLGIDTTLHAIPPGALSCDATNKTMRMDADKAKLDAAPKFEMSNWADCSDTNRVMEVYGYYGQQPYFMGNNNAATSINDRNADMRRVHNLPLNMDGTVNTTGGRQVGKALNDEAVRDVGGAQNTNLTQYSGGSWHQSDSTNGMWKNASCSSLGCVQSANKLMGSQVMNLQNEKIGKVKNLIVDLSSGRIVAVVVSTGHYTGMANELSAVPPSAFHFNKENKALQLDVSKESLNAAPHFTSDQWPDMSQPGYVGGVYSAYHVEPYFSNPMNPMANGTNAMWNTRDASENNPAWHNQDDNSMTNTAYRADNTGRNVRDRNNSTVTPLDQGNSQADINTTAQIRKEIIATDGMSLDGRNVKVITANGRVTLRGPVDNADEKRQIGDIANNIAGADNVNNQLEVKMANDN